MFLNILLECFKNVSLDNCYSFPLSPSPPQLFNGDKTALLNMA